MKYANYALFCLIFFLFPISSFSNVFDNLVLVSTRCVYQVERKSDGRELYFVNFPEGSGFFIGPHEKVDKKNFNAEYITTEGHNVACESESLEADFNIISVTRSEIYILFKDVSYRAEVVKEKFYPNDGLKDGFLHEKDEALLKIFMPKNVSHGHFSISEKYKVGEVVDVPGFISVNKLPRQRIAWIPAYRMGVITEIMKNLFRFDAQVYGGMSGSPVLVKRRNIFFPWKKKMFVIGIVNSTTSDVNGVLLHSALASRLDKDFLKK